jgi:hypothetical protein
VDSTTHEFSPVQLPIPSTKNQLMAYITAINASSIPPMFNASFIPSAAPVANASITLTPIDSLLTRIEASIFSGSVSGKKILDMTIAPGAFIMDAHSRYVANFTSSAGSVPPRKAI